MNETEKETLLFREEIWSKSVCLFTEEDEKKRNFEDKGRKDRKMRQEESANEQNRLLLRTLLLFTSFRMVTKTKTKTETK